LISESKRTLINSSGTMLSGEIASAGSNMDFTYKTEFSEIILIPESDRAKQWTLDNLRVKDWQTVLRGIRIDQEMIHDIADAVGACGLSIESD